MELRQLRYFARVFEEGSISKAAATIPIVQPALTQQLGRLEEELGVCLFVRSSKGVLPTEAGRLLYEYVKGILRQLDPGRLAAHLIAGARPLEGVVTLGLAPSTASVLGLNLLQQFRDKYPRVILNLVESISSHLEEMLLAGKLDLAILFATQSAVDIEQILLFEERFFLIGERSKLKPSNSKMSLRDAIKRKLILPTRFQRVRRQLDDAFVRGKLKPDIVAEVDSAQILVNAVIAGMGESIQPWSAIAHAKNKLTLIEISDKGFSRPNFLCCRPRYLLTPAAHMARGLVRDEVSKLIRSSGGEGYAMSAP